MTPADELRAAATRLRALVTDLGDCRGPWYVVNRDQRHYPQRIDNIGVPYVVASTTTDPSHPPVIADYIAAMDPRVGKALADWLDDEVHRYDASVRAADDVFHDDPDEHATFLATGPGAPNPHALTIARTINQEQP